jgi:hypothetical protein
VQSLKKWHHNQKALSNRNAVGPNPISAVAQTTALGASLGSTPDIKDISSLGYNTGFFCLTAQVVKVLVSTEKYVTMTVTDYNDNDHIE